MSIIIRDRLAWGICIDGRISTSGNLIGNSLTSWRTFEALCIAIEFSSKLSVKLSNRHDEIFDATWKENLENKLIPMIRSREDANIKNKEVKSRR